MEPVLLRNAQEGANQLLQVFKYGKNIGTATNDFMKKTVVLYGHVDRGWTVGVKNKYVSDHKRIKVLENEWRRQMGLGYTEPIIDISSKRSVFYVDLKKAIMFGKTDQEIAHKYWAAFNYLVTEYEASGYNSRTIREKKAKQALEATIRKMNPLDISVESKGRVKSRKEEFLSSLSSENRKLALKLEREYRYKLRAFNKIISQGKWKYKYSIYPY